MSVFEVIYEQNLRHGDLEKKHFFLLLLVFPISFLTYEFDGYTKQIRIHRIQTINSVALRTMKIYNFLFSQVFFIPIPMS